MFVKVDLVTLFSAVDIHESDSDCARIVESILNGTHPYHKYVADAIAWSASPGGADFYASTLEIARCLLTPPDIHPVVDAPALLPMVEGVGLCYSAKSVFLDVDLFISSSPLYTPHPTPASNTDRSVKTGYDLLSVKDLHIQDRLLSARIVLSDISFLKRILMLLGVPDGLSSRLVSHLWCAVVTQYTHNTVYFRLPKDWQWGRFDHEIVGHHPYGPQGRADQLGV
ncbi:hypothetical protein F5146DRAFT_1130496 [Armillaria mellea]|nr:hypothetical protein F5146DRAFT_1130496 [Armillaria mellea]